MQWIGTIFGWRDARSDPDDRQAFARKEAELQERLSRLEQEVEVIQRAESEEPGS